MENTIWKIFVFDECTGETMENMEGFGKEFESEDEAEAYCEKKNNWVHDGGFLTAHYCVQKNNEPVDIDAIMLGEED